MKRDRTFHEAKAKEYLSSLTTEQKWLLLCGTPEEIAEAGLPQLVPLGEAAHGVQARHDQSFDLGEPVCTTVFQNPVGFAATWDPELMREVGELTGIEGRSLFTEGKHPAICMLAPTVDMERDPRWGRNEEAYGEDPYLTSRIAGAYALGMAGEDPRYVRCGATLKHFYGNNVEDDRCRSHSRMPEKLKDSYYIHVFEEMIDLADPIAVMASYNFVNDVSCTFNPEITTRLKKRGLPLVMSDGGAVELTITRQKAAKDSCEAMVNAVKAGMDIYLDRREMIREGLEQALSEGLLTWEELDRALYSRMLASSLLGLLPGEEGAFSPEEYHSRRVDTEEGRSLARRAAAESAVLLKNENASLPLKEEDRVCLLGPFADRCPLDWYGGITSHQVTWKEGLGEKCALSEGLYPYVRIRVKGGAEGREPRYLGMDGERVILAHKENAETFRIMLWDDCRITLRSMTTGKLLTSHTPKNPIINGEEPEIPFRLYASREDAFSWFVQEAFLLQDAEGKDIHFNAEDALHFWEDERIDRIRNTDGELRLFFETVTDVEELLEKAKEVYASEKGAKRVIAAFGLHPIINGKEERDRTSIELPPFQRAVLRLIRKRFDKIILILHTNSPVAIAEEDDDPCVSSVLWMATGSEEYGNALADVLYGRTSPAGGLCQTWYRSDSQLGEKEDYDIEKNRMTYLYLDEEPLYPFGYGLSYTQFKMEILSQSGGEGTMSFPCGPADTVAGEVTVNVENTGNYASDVVIRVYRKKDGGYRLFEREPHPGDRLAGFTRVKQLQPGERRTLTIPCRY